MKLKTMHCPNNCRIDKKTLQKMQIVSTVEKQYLGGAASNRYTTIINWRCPICGKEIPVSPEDVRKSSRHMKARAGTTTRKGYIKEE